MQEILNTLIITIAIAFLALMVTDFVAGLTVLATATDTPASETPVLPLSVDVPEVEEVLVPTPKTQALGHLLLEEYELENQQYWATWHRTFSNVTSKLFKNSKVTLNIEVTTPNFPEIETVNETRTLRSFEGIDYETMLHTNWQTATPLSCDPCNFQFCSLPEPQPSLKQTKRAGRSKKEVQTLVKTPVQTVAQKRRGRPRKTV